MAFIGSNSSVPSSLDLIRQHLFAGKQKTKRDIYLQRPHAHTPPEAFETL